MINLFRLIKLKNQDSNGSFAWQKNQKMKIALFYKPSTMKACISVFVLMYIFCQPSLASAGFLSDLVDKIVGNKTQASEIEPANTEVIHNSQNVPLLESSINPDLKNIKDEPTPVSISSNTALSNNGNLDVDSELEKYDSNVKITTYTVKKGDTLDSIAKKLKISKATIIASNTDLKKSDLLKVGQPLAIFGIKPDVKEVPVKNEKTIVKKEEEPKETKKVVVETKQQAPKEEPIPAPIVQAPVVTTPIIEPPVQVAQPQQPEPQTPTGQPEGGIDGGYIWPFPKGIGRVSQGLHADQAIDFAAPKGTPIYAVSNGTVLIAHPTGYNGGYGRYVVINFDDGRQAIFGHMSEVTATPGQVVKKGDVIGFVGSTGKSTGPHLHLGFHFESGSGLGNPYIGLKVNSTDFIDNE